MTNAICWAGLILIGAGLGFIYWPLAAIWAGFLLLAVSGAKRGLAMKVEQARVEEAQRAALDDMPSQQSAERVN